LLVRRVLPFDKETTTYELFTLHPPILYMGLCQTALVNVALNITLMSVDTMFAIPMSVLLKNDATLPFWVTLLSGQLYDEFLTKEEHGVSKPCQETLS
jgi:hypothetical protein